MSARRERIDEFARGTPERRDPTLRDEVLAYTYDGHVSGPSDFDERVGGGVLAERVGLTPPPGRAPPQANAPRVVDCPRCRAPAQLEWFTCSHCHASIIPVRRKARTRAKPPSRRAYLPLGVCAALVIPAGWLLVVAVGGSDHPIEFGTRPARAALGPTDRVVASTTVVPVTSPSPAGPRGLPGTAASIGPVKRPRPCWPNAHPATARVNRDRIKDVIQIVGCRSGAGLCITAFDGQSGAPIAQTKRPIPGALPNGTSRVHIVGRYAITCAGRTLTAYRLPRLRRAWTTKLPDAIEHAQRKRRWLVVRTKDGGVTRIGLATGTITAVAVNR